MKRRAAALLASLQLLVLAGCASAPMERVAIPGATLASAPRLPPLACAFSLQAIVDERPAGDQAGGLGRNAYEIGDAVEVVRQQLQTAGFTETGPAPQVIVGLQRLYVAHNLATKIPMAVYRVGIDDDPGFIVRSQASSINWDGSGDEARRAFVRALHDANTRLVAALNSRCAGRTS